MRVTLFLLRDRPAVLLHASCNGPVTRRILTKIESTYKIRFHLCRSAGTCAALPRNWKIVLATADFSREIFHAVTLQRCCGTMRGLRHVFVILAVLAGP
jgi:hypothetical protein